MIVNVGDSIHWTNQSSSTQNVVADDGTFDSADLPPGAGFSFRLSAAGIYAYGSSLTPSFRGDVRVGQTGLVGPPTDLASNHIPDQPFPADDPAQYSEHPTLGVQASRTRILLGFTATRPGAALPRRSLLAS